jgi:hypothetical protein
MVDAQQHLLFVSKPSGYEFAERDGQAPEVGTAVDEGETRFVVTRVAPSPLPGDSRACAYLQPI